MKALRTLIILLVITGSLGLGIFFYAKRDKLVSGFYPQIELLLIQLQKSGLPGTSKSIFDRNIGTCMPVKANAAGVLVEVPNEFVPYGRPVKLNGTSLVCLFNDPGIAFKLNTVEHGVVTIYRELGMPAIIEINEGMVSISSLKLGIILKAQGQRIETRSAQSAVILARVDKNSSNFGVDNGPVTMNFQADESDEAKINVIQLRAPTSDGSLSINGGKPLLPGQVAHWLPSGLKLVETKSVLDAPRPLDTTSAPPKSP